LQFIYAGIAHLGEPGLIITFEQFPEQIYRDALNFGWDLRGLEEQDQLRVICTSPQLLRQELEEPGGLIEILAAEVGAKRVMVDSITHFQRLTDDPVKLRELLNTFLNGLKRQRFTSILIKELNEVGGLQSHFEAFMVDVALRISYDPDPGGLRRRRTLEVLKTRGQPHRSGQHPFEFGPHGVEVYPNPLATDVLGNPMVRVPTGVPGLDEMLRGGFVGGFCTLVAGDTGTGKTTLGLQFLHAGVQAGEPCLFVTLEERMYKIFAAAEGFGFLRDLIAKRLFTVLSVPAAGTNVNRLFADISQHIEKRQIQRVVVDGLADLQALIPNSAVLREYLFALISLFERHAITSLLTNEIRDTPHAAAIDPALSPFVDTILYLRCREQSGILRRYLSILKMRTSAHDMRVRSFEISAGGISILPEPAPHPDSGGI